MICDLRRFTLYSLLSPLKVAASSELEKTESFVRVRVREGWVVGSQNLNRRPSVKNCTNIVILRGVKGGDFRFGEVGKYGSVTFSFQ